MTAGRAGAARTRARTSTARMMERSRRISPLFSAGEEIPAAATEPVAAAEPTTTTEAEGGAEGATEEVEETKPLSELEIAKMEKLAEIERLRAKEVFITEKTGETGMLILSCTRRMMDNVRGNPRVRLAENGCTKYILTEGRNTWAQANS